jgi:fibronectin-binding autotransporter adhesin
MSFRRITPLLLISALLMPAAHAQRQMEKLNRGLIAMRKSSTQVYLSWRLFGDDPSSVTFNVYRSANGGTATKLNSTPISATTDYTDTPASLSTIAYSYFVRPVINGVEQANSEAVSLTANPAQKQFLTLPLRSDTGAYGPYDVKFCWVGDLDGDGAYDFVVDRLSTQGAYEQYLEAYKSDGTFLWRINMGPNSVNQYAIEPGASAISVGHSDHVTVYDLDGDGKAEVILKTANGTILGDGTVVTASDNTTEYISVLDGLTGAEKPNGRATVPNPYASEGPLAGHFGILYLDGKRPSFLFQGKNRNADESFNGTITTWDYRNNQLTQRWSWLQDSTHAPEGHQIRMSDVDDDGKDEFIDIGFVMDDNGTQLFNIPEVTHGDRFHVADIDPDRPGLETYIIQQNNTSGLATAFYETGTGKIIKKWYAGDVVDVGRGIALDINSANKGYEMYSTQPGIYNSKGKQIYANNVWAPEGLWWDGDLGREFIDGAGSGAYNPIIQKFNATTGVSDRVWTLYNDWGSYSVHQANGGRPAFWGDILGDWREELVLMQSDYAALRIYTTTTPATNRLYTLMHNPQYRMQTTTKGYVQSSYVDYYLGYGMPSVPPPPPMIPSNLTWAAGTTWDASGSSSWVDSKTGVASPYTQGNSVLFDVSGSNASSIALSGTLSPGAVSFYNPQDYTINGSAGSLSGAMTFGKSGKGKTTLTGTHSYTGATTIWDGALVVDGTLSGSAVTVWGGTWGGGLAKGNTGGRLGGSGTIQQPVSLQYRGAITPGSGMGATGTLKLNSSLTAADGAVLAMDLSNDPSGATKANDKITVAGNLTLSGTTTIAVNALNGSLAPGTYTLLTYGGTLSGSASNFSVSVPDGTPYNLAIGSGALTLTIPTTRAASSITWAGGQNGNVWDIANTTNWLRSGSSDVFVSGDQVTFNDSGAANATVSLSTVLPVASLTVDSTANYTFSGDGAIAGTGGLTKSGTGTLTLSNTNTYTGPTVISGGTLAVDNLNDGGTASSIGASGTAASNLVLNGATLSLVGSQTNTNRSMTVGSGGGTIQIPTSNSSLQISGQVTGAGALTKTGPGTLILASANSYTGGTIIKEGTIYLASDTANVSGLGTGLVTLQGGTLSMTDVADTPSAATSSWNIYVPSGSSGRLNADSRCTLNGALTGGGDFTFYTPFVRTELGGNWSAFTGIIHVITDSDGGDFRMRGNGGYPSAAVDLGDGVYAYYNISGAATIPMGTLSGTSGAVLLGGNSASSTVTYQIGARNEDSTFAGTIKNSTGPTALTKVGTGVLTLSGANTYTGATTVSAGTLRINGTSSASAFTVQSGGTLGGTGTITGSVNVQTGGALEYLDLGTTPLTITGNLNLSGRITIRPKSGTSLAAGTYTLLNYSGTLSGTPSFTWAKPVGSTLEASFSTSTTGVVTMTLTDPGTSTKTILWSGASSFTWDTSALNWTRGGSVSSYVDNDEVQFTDLGNATSTISLSGTLSPASVRVEATKNYTLGGTGSISGTTGLTKLGSGTLTISSAQSYTGDTVIQEGTLVMGNASALGTGNVILDGGSWDTGSLTVTNPIVANASSTILGGSGGGTHGIKNITGNADLALSTTSVFDLEGDFSAYSGTMSFTGTGSFRLFNVTNNASALATFDLGTRTLSARSGGAFNLGCLKGQAGSYLTMASNSTSTSCTFTIGGNNQDGSFAGLIVNGASNRPVAIVKTGTGTLTLSGANTYTGTTTVSGGKLSVTGSLGATTTTIASAATLGGNGTLSGAVTCSGALTPADGGLGTLGFGAGLSLASTSVLNFDLGASTASDKLAITGNLTLDGTLNVTESSGLSAGAYTIATYTGTLTNNTLNVGTLPAGFSGSISAGSGNVILTLTSTRPSIATAATASSTSVTGKTVNLSVLGADNGGEASLTYTWVATPAGPTFSANSINAAKNTTVTFSEPGTYNFTATVTDASGYTAASTTQQVTVTATATTISVSPTPVTLLPGGQQGFTALVKDQFDQQLSPTLQWSASGGGSIDATGFFTATTAGGPFTVQASTGSISAQASITVNKIPATISLGDLSVTYTGSAKPASVTTTPGGLSHAVTYAGSATAPSAVGSYPVVATITAQNYSGSATGTLVISYSAYQQWQIDHFGSIDAANAGADADPDADGSSNQVEYLLGLDPLSGASAFRAHITPVNGGMRIDWPYAAGLNFSVLRATNLTGSWQEISTITGAGSFTDPSPPPGRAFYKVSFTP